jgi:cobalt-zinc-cadmium efflux system protein
LHTHQNEGQDASHQPHRRLLWSLVLTLGFSLIEAIAGWWSGSLALLSDAGHMLTDSLALALAALAAILARRGPSARHSYGWGRAEILAALLNTLVMLAMIAAISAEAVHRLGDPQPVAGTTVIFVAFVGLLVNLVAAWLLSGGRENLNVRAALLHVLGDLLGSIAALVSGAVIVLTGWMMIDPLLSVLIVLLILVSAMRVLHEVLHALMEGVPSSLDLERVGLGMAATDGVVSVHDLHIWSLSASRTALSAHIVLNHMGEWPAVLARLQSVLARGYGIEHVTLQPEPRDQLIAVDALRAKGVVNAKSADQAPPEAPAICRSPKSPTLHRRRPPMR